MHLCPTCVAWMHNFACQKYRSKYALTILVGRPVPILYGEFRCTCKVMFFSSLEVVHTTYWFGKFKPETNENGPSSINNKNETIYIYICVRVSSQVIPSLHAFLDLHTFEKEISVLSAFKLILCVSISNFESNHKLKKFHQEDCQGFFMLVFSPSSPVIKHKSSNAFY